MARDLTVRLIGDSRSLERAFQRSERSAKKFAGTMATTSSRLKSRGALFGGMFGVSGPTAAAGGAFLLGRQFTNAARDAEVILGQTSVAVQDAGLSWTKYAKRVEDASTRISQSSAFDDEQVMQSFATFVRGQKDVEKSLRLTELAADVARGRYIDLEQATQLVNKAAMGQIGSLRRAGIQIDKNATSAEALDKLQRAYAGSAKVYADSAVGATEKLQVAWENLAETVGGPLSEALAAYATQLTVIIGLMQKLGKMKIPGLPGGAGNGLLGKAAKFAAKGVLVGISPAVILGDLFGGGGKGPSVVQGPGFLDNITSAVESMIAGVTGTGKKAMATRAIADANSVLDDAVAFINKWTSAGSKFDAAQKQAEEVRKAADARRARIELQRQRFAAGLENQRGWLQFGIERADATKQMRDDITSRQKYAAWLRNRIRLAGHTLTLTRELWRVQQEIRDLNKRKTDVDPLAGLVQVSSARLAGMLAAGTGLGAGGVGRLAQNVSGLELHNHVYLDGRQVASSVNRANAGDSRRTARQTSGFRA